VWLRDMHQVMTAASRNYNKAYVARAQYSRFGMSLFRARFNRLSSARTFVVTNGMHFKHGQESLELWYCPFSVAVLSLLNYPSRS
jgi:hypothetical protein